LDGAHNAEGVKAALETWAEVYGAPPRRVIFGCLKDKPADEMLRIIRRTGAKIWGVELNDLRASDPLSWKTQPVQLFSTVSKALLADQKEPESKGTLILGSLVLVGEVLKTMGLRGG
jgi:folylpolyglutamate synthase/dihydropteroate synthase